MEREEIVERILEIAPGLHTATTFPTKVLRAIARRLAQRSVRHSAETGSGASTLLFSQFSEDHTVFADDAGSGSVRNVESSALLRPGVVQFVEGPTQRTLPSHHFSNRLDAVLLDGPHAYPFPELEYYFLYPHLDTGALLIVDDIQIRGVHNLFEFLRRDRMFRLDEVVHTTAFFTRTDAPTFSPAADGWWEQEYNRRPLLRYVWRERLKSLLPPGLRAGLSRIKRGVSQHVIHPGCEIRIVRPNAEEVGATGTVQGTAMLASNVSLWVLVRRADSVGWWPQAGPVPISDGRWSANVSYGEPRDCGHAFEIRVLAVGPATTNEWLRWLDRAKATGSWPPVALPAPEFIYAESLARVMKSQRGVSRGDDSALGA
ncbi:MAG: class I SAM-dependent methyltransferase [Bryobacterales bacterium]